MGRIILADDDELVAGLVIEALMAAGHAVGWLQDGKSALEVIESRRPDLAILDCNMPGMTGMEVLRAVRASDTLFDLPVMMLTGRRSQADEQILRYDGANDYLRKPFDPVMLVGRAERLMDGRRKWD